MRRHTRRYRAVFIPGQDCRVMDKPATEPRWVPPTKQVKNLDLLEVFKHGPGYSTFVGFLQKVNSAILDEHNPEAALSKSVTKLLDFISEIRTIFQAIPPEPKRHRFGNLAFRTFHTKLGEEAPRLIAGLLPERLRGASVELLPYLLDSFGNALRLDYGTGHELHFVCFLLVLHHVGFLADADLAAVGARGFFAYIQLTWEIEDVYTIEPAGTRGAYALDPYHVVPFFWGSAEQARAGGAYPAGAPGTMYHASAQRTIEKGSGSCIRSVHGHCKAWLDLNRGVGRMIEGEELSSFPVMQHFLFGSVVKFRR
eukprot:gnl/Chilomastix_cuspidata/2253.p1 GENE.gnl/Chilomastix_cuspidata/2253~~gnl/Chilomastix_cuspidata/2253.p1  ORF type:complete len:311 (+),score=109.52 gnl/Chilomastix_cuspidata/2253:116-1048(+)